MEDGRGWECEFRSHSELVSVPLAARHFFQSSTLPKSAYCATVKAKPRGGILSASYLKPSIAVRNLCFEMVAGIYSFLGSRWHSHGPGIPS